MTLGGATVVAAYTLFAVLLALVVVAVACWAQLEGRRARGDRLGRALAPLMRGLEAGGARAAAAGRSLLEPRTPADAGSGATPTDDAPTDDAPTDDASTGGDAPAGGGARPERGPRVAARARSAAAGALDAVARGAGALSGRLAAQGEARSPESPAHARPSVEGSPAEEVPAEEAPVPEVPVEEVPVEEGVRGDAARGGGARVERRRPGRPWSRPAPAPTEGGAEPAAPPAEDHDRTTAGAEAADPRRDRLPDELRDRLAG
ncbi:hypothetical protein [uncultured Pseudokineococcus sp.]|uniref:hypothetical protein n=1 Tax=uncultured Pseudokineococcus sp. TaxID=1642928 RepID=UPI002611A876|nr:hypothetical protein [uncultured Pseudokineococcus sp.]